MALKILTQKVGGQISWVSSRRKHFIVVAVRYLNLCVSGTKILSKQKDTNFSEPIEKKLQCVQTICMS